MSIFNSNFDSIIDSNIHVLSDALELTSKELTTKNTKLKAHKDHKEKL
jgi:hypothetical protein